MASAISRPLEDILLGAAFAMRGIFVEPYKGARLRGKVGFVSGVAVGALGIVTKPLVGIFDAFAHASETVHDAARLLNVEEKKLIVRVRRLRLPYIFGLCNILLPYDPIDCRSMSLLHRLDMSKGKGEYEIRLREPTNEVLVVSEVLDLPKTPGLDTYVVITNRRIVLFEVKTENVQPQVLLQIDFQSEVEIISSLEDRGLIVLRIASYKPMSLIERNDSLSSIPEDVSEIEASDIDGTETDQPVLHIKPNEAISYHKGGHKHIQKPYKLIGDSSHLGQLTRIHNAICCLSKNYSSVIIDDGTKSDEAGYVHFKSMMFDTRSEATEMERVFAVDLDQIMWLDQKRDRNNWTLADEEKLSRNLGGPEWLVRARARNMFTPMPVTSSAYISSSSTLEELTVQNETKTLNSGLISVTQTNADFSSVTAAGNTKTSADDTSEEITQSPNSSNTANQFAIVPYENQLVPNEGPQTEKSVVLFLKRKK